MPVLYVAGVVGSLDAHARRLAAAAPDPVAVAVAPWRPSPTQVQPPAGGEFARFLTAMFVPLDWSQDRVEEAITDVRAAFTDALDGSGVESAIVPLTAEVWDKAVQMGDLQWWLTGVPERQASWVPLDG